MDPDETGKTEANHSLTIGTILVVLILLAFATMLFVRSGTDSTDRQPPGVRKIDRLYYEMGILGIANIAPPMDVVLRDLNDQRVALSDFQGKIVFLNFWATWCPACRVEMPAMEKLHKRFKDRDFAMIAISMQEPGERVESFFKEHKLSFTALLDSDGAVSSRFGVISIPTTYIIDRDGGIIGKVVGAREWYGKESISLFEHLIDVGFNTPDEDVETASPE
jgi:peroxiredoxin